MIRISLTILLTLLILGGISYIFWQQEWKYSQPTTVPTNLVQKYAGDSIPLNLLTQLNSTKEAKLFVHFYNYDCPCSRFNIKEFENLVLKYKNDIQFVAVIEAIDERASNIKEEFTQKYDLNIPTYVDTDGSIAKALGIYSTPQAVIIDNQQIFYKGNYNKARFCTTKNTKFADLALAALLNNQAAPEFPAFADIAYGCELPSNGNQLSRLEKIFNF